MPPSAAGGGLEILETMVPRRDGERIEKHCLRMVGGGFSAQLTQNKKKKTDSGVSEGNLLEAAEKPKTRPKNPEGFGVRRKKRAPQKAHFLKM